MYYIPTIFEKRLSGSDVIFVVIWGEKHRVHLASKTFLWCPGYILSTYGVSCSGPFHMNKSSGLPDYKHRSLMGSGSVLSLSSSLNSVDEGESPSFSTAFSAITPTGRFYTSFNDAMSVNMKRCVKPDHNRQTPLPIYSLVRKLRSAPRRRDNLGREDEKTRREDEKKSQEDKKTRSWISSSRLL